MRKIRIFFSRLPFTLTMLVALVIGALITNTYFDQITRHWLKRTGFAPNDLWYWRLERIFTSALVTVGGKVFWEAILMVAVFVGLAEWMTGWKRAAATFWGVHLLALVLLSLIVALFLHQLRAFGLEAAEAARDVGPSAGYFACLGLVSARLKRPWTYPPLPGRAPHSSFRQTWRTCWLFRWVGFRHGLDLTGDIKLPTKEKP
jgi:hypothetical protein